MSIVTEVDPFQPSAPLDSSVPSCIGKRRIPTPTPCSAALGTDQRFKYKLPISLTHFSQ